MADFFSIVGYAITTVAITIVICAAFRVKHSIVNALPFVLIAVATICLVAYATEAFISLRSGPYQRAAFDYRLFGQYWSAYWIMLVSTALLPQLFWNRSIRHSRIGLIILPLICAGLPHLPLLTHSNDFS